MTRTPTCVRACSLFLRGFVVPAPFAAVRWCLTGSPLLFASDGPQIGQNSYRSHEFGSSGYRRFGGDLRRSQLLIDNEPTKQLFRRVPCLAWWRTSVRIDIALG